MTPRKSSKPLHYLLWDLYEMSHAVAEIVAEGRARYLSTMRQQWEGERAIMAIANVIADLPDSYKDQYPKIPWRAIVGMRNVIAHEYADVDDAIVWNTLEISVPDLVRTLGLAEVFADGEPELDL